MTIRLGSVIAFREFRHPTKGKRKIVVRLGKPRMLAKDEWSCPYHIRGQGDDKLQEAYGIDAFQALMMALEGIRANLQASDKSLTWEGGEPGDIGFPRFVPSFYGLNFSQKVEGIIDREVQRFANGVEPKQNKKERNVRNRPTATQSKKNGLTNKRKK